MPSNSVIPIFDFRGLTNALQEGLYTHRELRIGLNIDIDDKGWLHSRARVTELADADSLYVNPEKTIGFATANNNLYQINPINDSLVLLKSNIGSGPYCWTSTGPVFFVMGQERGWVITPQGIRPWGMDEITSYNIFVHGVSRGIPAGEYRIAVARLNLDTGLLSGVTSIRSVTVSQPSKLVVLLSESLGADEEAVLLSSNTNGSILYIAGRFAGGESVELATVDHLAQPFKFTATQKPPVSQGPLVWWKGSVYVSQYDPGQNYSELIGSQVNDYHHFSLDGLNDISEYAHIRMAVRYQDRLLLGTEREIIVYSSVDNRTVIAPYGVPVGVQWDYDHTGAVWFTTIRGVRKFDGELSDPTEGKFLADWGSVVGAGFVHKDGIQQFITCTLEPGEVPSFFPIIDPGLYETP